MLGRSQGTCRHRAVGIVQCREPRTDTELFHVNDVHAMRYKTYLPPICPDVAVVRHRCRFCIDNQGTVPTRNEDDIAVSRAKRRGNQRIGLRVPAARGAQVVFQIVAAPIGIGQRVLIFVAMAAGTRPKVIRPGRSRGQTSRPWTDNVIGRAISSPKELLVRGVSRRHPECRASNRDHNIFYPASFFLRCSRSAV